MKLRHSFVSNSSSTSFVVVGYLLQEDAVVEMARNAFPGFDIKSIEDVYEAFNDKDIIFRGEVYGHSNKYLVGKALLKSDSDSGCFDETMVFDDDTMNMATDEVKDVLRTNIEPSLIVGTYAS